MCWLIIAQARPTYPIATAKLVSTDSVRKEGEKKCSLRMFDRFRHVLSVTVVFCTECGQLLSWADSPYWHSQFAEIYGDEEKTECYTFPLDVAIILVRQFSNRFFTPLDGVFIFKSWQFLKIDLYDRWEGEDMPCHIFFMTNLILFLCCILILRYEVI